jgi:hypothetical protein
LLFKAIKNIGQAQTLKYKGYTFRLKITGRGANELTITCVALNDTELRQAFGRVLECWSQPLPAERPLPVITHRADKQRPGKYQYSLHSVWNPPRAEYLGARAVADIPTATATQPLLPINS